MSLLISINGSDFEPYSSVTPSQPLIKKMSPAKKVNPVDRQTDSPGSFSQLIRNADRPGFQSYSKVIDQSKRAHTRAIHAEDLMSTPVYTLDRSQTTKSAIELLKQKSIRHIPIVESEDILVGIVSDRDIALNESEELISQYMKTETIAAQPRTLLREITLVMVTRKINCLPIIDSDRHVVGIITSSDILESVARRPEIMELWI